MVGVSDRGGTQPLNSRYPCSEFPGVLPSPFVYDNYYCESGRLLNDAVTVVYTDDPVWDGDGCSDGNNCCSDPSLPWFYRQLPRTASEDIETRICCNENNSNKDVLVREFQLYVT